MQLSIFQLAILKNFTNSSCTAPKYDIV